MEIKIYGSGCTKCKKLEENVREALTSLKKIATVIKITDMDEIIEKGIMMTPALEVNGKVVSTGKVLAPEEIKKFLK